MAPSMHQDYPQLKTTESVGDNHPRYFRLFLHAASVAFMYSGFAGLQSLAINKLVAPQYGGFFQFLTIIGLMASAGTMAFAGLSDLLPAVTSLRAVKRGLLLFSLPVEFVIAALYWSLVTLKPDLMFPTKAEYNITSTDPGINKEPSSANDDLLFRIPFWMDVSMHAFPAIILTLEFFLFEKKFHPPTSTTGANLLAGIFGSTYVAWIEYASTINGKFPYPFLDLMPAWGRALLYVGSVIVSVLAFRFLNWIHR